MFVILHIPTSEYVVTKKKWCGPYEVFKTHSLHEARWHLDTTVYFDMVPDKGIYCYRYGGGICPKIHELEIIEVPDDYS